MQDIDNILNQYFQIGLINREKAIAKIRELNKDVGRTVIGVLPCSFIPFNDASDAPLAAELNRYREILTENYLRNMQEEMPNSSI